MRSSHFNVTSILDVLITISTIHSADQKKSVGQEKEENYSDLSFNNFNAKEILLKIFGYLSANEIIKASAVSKKWYNFSNELTLWKSIPKATYLNLRKNLRTTPEFNNQQLAASKSIWEDEEKRHLVIVINREEEIADSAIFSHSPRSTRRHKFPDPYEQINYDQLYKHNYALRYMSDLKDLKNIAVHPSAFAHYLKNEKDFELCTLLLEMSKKHKILYIVVINENMEAYLPEIWKPYAVIMTEGNSKKDLIEKISEKVSTLSSYDDPTFQPTCKTM